jgi:ABC-type Fe3+-siderophore transport system permease subunit
MQLINIDKKRYRKHLNIVIAGFIGTLLILSLIFGQLLIASFAQEGVSNFRYNLLGVMLSLLACAGIMHTLKNSDAFKEIYYVWKVKQLQNLIYRKLKKIKVGVSNDEHNALIILVFYYQSLIQVYKLDDNTLTISDVEKRLSDLQDVIAEKNLTVSADQFDKELLNFYR